MPDTPNPQRDAGPEQNLSTTTKLRDADRGAMPDTPNPQRDAGPEQNLSTTTKLRDADTKKARCQLYRH